jgi:ubiquitin-protein ligase
MYCRELPYRRLHFVDTEISYNSIFFKRGPPDSPFAGGEYHGVLLFPSEYPFKPPGIKVGLCVYMEPCYHLIVFLS